MLAAVRRWDEGGYFSGGGTDTAGALRMRFAGHDRVVIRRTGRRRGNVSDV